MAVAPYKTYIAGEVLTAADLVNSFLQIHNNGDDLASPATKAHDMNGFQLILDADADTGIRASTDDRIDLMLGGDNLFAFHAVTALEVNGLDFNAAIVTQAPQIEAIGSDTDISINLIPKGAGTVQVNGGPITGDENMNSILAMRVYF